VAYFKPFVVTDGSNYQNWGLAIFRTLLGILILPKLSTLGGVPWRETTATSTDGVGELLSVASGGARQLILRVPLKFCLP
jgi:hypothetical protein